MIDSPSAMAAVPSARTPAATTPARFNGRKRHLVVDARDLPLFVMVSDGHPVDLHDIRAVIRESFAVASRFRDDFFDCLTARGDTLFEMTDALLCVDGPVTTPVDPR